MRKTGAIGASEETAPGLVIDYTERGQIVAIEVLDASERVSLPLLLESIGSCSSLGRGCGVAIAQLSRSARG
nr:DUF2283 domain-containing protein [Baaleninema simplex]